MPRNIQSRFGPDSVPAAFIQQQRPDPAEGIDGAPPNLGRMVPPHIHTVSGRYSGQARSYPIADEALRDSMQNAERMRNDTLVMECLEARQRSTALLNWHVKPEDEESSDQEALAEEVTKIINRIPNFVEYRRNCQEALWYGRYMVCNQFSSMPIGGKWRKCVTHWEPRHGDKLVFRYDDGTGRYNPNQVGIRVGTGSDLEAVHDTDYRGYPYRKVEATQYGLAYWLDQYERELCVVHRHMIEDGPFEDPLAQGRIHGVGIRSRIYWTWYGLVECLGNLLEYVERSALGVEIWRYPAGNAKAEQLTLEAAHRKVSGGRSVVLVPVYAGEDSDQFGVEHIEPGLGGVEQLRSLIEEFFGHRIKRYILGQTLSSEAAATGLGSGVADAHLATYGDIIQYDAGNLEETLTRDLVRKIQLANFPNSKHVWLRFVIDTQSEDAEAKMQSYKHAWDMGAGIKEDDVLATIGASAPEEGDNVLQNPQLAQGAGGMFGGMMGGMGGGDGASLDLPDGMKQNPGVHFLHPEGNGNNGNSRHFVPARYQQNTPIRIPANAVNTEPTEAQRQTGNYKKHHMRLHGMEIAIENPAGSRRRPEWPKLKWHYGYIKRTTGNDGDHVDCFVGPDPDSEIVFVIDQVSAAGKFDEHKAMIGWSSTEAARKAYCSNYQKGWKVGPITPMTVAAFKAWLCDGDQDKPVSRQVSKYAAKFDESQHPRGAGGEFIKANEAVMQGQSHAEWSGKIGDAFTSEQIDEDHPIMSHRDSVGLQDYFNASKLANKQVRSATTGAMGRVADFSEDLKRAIVEHDDGQRSEHGPDQLDDYFDYIHDKAKRDRLSDSHAARAGKLIAQAAHEAGENLHNYFRSEFPDLKGGAHLKLRKATVDAANELAQERQAAEAAEREAGASDARRRAMEKRKATDSQAQGPQKQTGLFGDTYEPKRSAKAPAKPKSKENQGMLWTGLDRLAGQRDFLDEGQQTDDTGPRRELFSRRSDFQWVVHTPQRYEWDGTPTYSE